MESFGEQMAFKLGLHLFMAYGGKADTETQRFYKAEDIHALLEQSQTVVRFEAIGGRWGLWEPLNALNSALAEQEGILIGIKPIQKDTVETLLKEIIEWMNPASEKSCPERENFFRRAKKLLK